LVPKGILKFNNIYLILKVQKSNWKIGKIGGIRRSAFSKSKLELVELILWTLIQINPLLTLKEILKTLKLGGISTNRTWLIRKFSSWCWSFKKPNYKQINKYTSTNIEYYGRFIVWISDIPWIHLKFLDESSFASHGNTMKISFNIIFQIFKEQKFLDQLENKQL